MLPDRRNLPGWRVLKGIIRNFNLFDFRFNRGILNSSPDPISNHTNQNQTDTETQSYFHRSLSLKLKPALTATLQMSKCSCKNILLPGQV